MNRAMRMGAEVGQVAARLGTALECVTCGIGIAVDMVGKRWGEDPYDWKGERFGHECKLTRAGLTPAQIAKVAEIQKHLERWAQTQRGESHQATMPDSRLPPEREDLL